MSILYRRGVSVERTQGGRKLVFGVGLLGMRKTLTAQCGTRRVERRQCLFGVCGCGSVCRGRRGEKRCVCVL